MARGYVDMVPGPSTWSVSWNLMLVRLLHHIQAGSQSPTSQVPHVNIHSSSRHLSGCSVLQSQTVISILLIVVILYHFILFGFYM